MLNRKFNRNEKILLVILVSILLVLLYKVVVIDATADAVLSAKITYEQAESSYMLESIKAARLQEMRAELEKQANDTTIIVSKIPHYDNLSKLMVYLNTVLTKAADYNLSFQPISIEDSYAKRVINMSFTCADYPTAKQIVFDLYACPFRSSIDGLSISGRQPNGNIDNVINLKTSTEILVSLSICFTERAE